MTILQTNHVSNGWLGAIQQGVENIDVGCMAFFYVDNNMFNIFSYATLVELKLDGPDFSRPDSDGPPVNLPSLKTLHLTNTFFRKPQDFLKFVYNCPIL